MVKVPIYSPSKKQVGFVDTNDKTYNKMVDYKQGQMFTSPKYAHSIGISRSIIKELIKLNVEKLSFYIFNYEETPFYAIQSLKEFLTNSQKVNFKGSYNSDEQYICKLQFFTRVAVTQNKLSSMM